MDITEKELAQLRTDATRYRWLRTQRHTDNIHVAGRWKNYEMVNWTCNVLDEAIDREMDSYEPS